MDITSESVVAIFGKRGSGKSYTLGVLAEGICTVEARTSLGRCSRRKGALLLDTLNVFWSAANPFLSAADRERFPREVRRLDAWSIEVPQLDVRVWIPAGFRNPHSPVSYVDFSIAPSELSAEDIASLLEVDAQDLMGQLLAEAREKAASLRPNFSFEDMLGILESDSEVQEYYAEATRRGARQRLRAVAMLPVFNSTAPTPLRDLLVAGRLSVVELGDIPNSLRTVLASVLLKRIHRERARAADAEKQLALNTRLSQDERDRLRHFLASTIPPSWVLVDEAQNILPSSREVKSSEAVLQFVREGRNFGLSFALTTQQPSAVDQRILAQADTVICHKLTVAQDMTRMRENLKSAEPMEVKLGGGVLDLMAWLRSLEMGKALVTNTEYERVFAIEVRPRVTPHGGTGFRSDVVE
jgi:DNA helicase HerA-like ATPase